MTDTGNQHIFLRADILKRLTDVTGFLVHQKFQSLRLPIRDIMNGQGFTFRVLPSPDVAQNIGTAQLLRAGSESL